MTATKTPIRAAALAGAVATLFPLAAGAQTQTPIQARNCADHAAVVLRLAEGYGESRQAIALSGDNTVVEIFASAETGTWTITVTAAGGPTCLVAAGDAYQTLNDALPNTDPGA